MMSARPRVTGRAERFWTRTLLKAMMMDERILMIEDDKGLGDMVAEYLSSSGFQVEVKPSGSEGLSALEREPFAALILDVMLPDIDGFEICHRVRADSDIPILMLTARGEDTDRIVGLELGADDYLPKPFNPRELVARLKAILRRRVSSLGGPGGPGGPRTSQDAAVLRFGRLEIDRDARRVQLDGEPRSLTGYQFDLLVALAENAGRVLSREQLMNRVKGEQLEAFDRSIDVHVSRIRAAIEDDPGHPRRVLTVRGAGYVFARSQEEDWKEP